MTRPKGARKRPEISFAPRETFEEILEWSVIPTFDLVVELPDDSGIVLVRRIIAPYENAWALPGLRMFKPEGIDDVIARTAEDELGLTVDVDGKRFHRPVRRTLQDRARAPRPLLRLRRPSPDQRTPNQRGTLLRPPRHQQARPDPHLHRRHV